VLIFVTGFYGAGKSTLVHAALAALGGLEYLKTTTTRPPRAEEVEFGSTEYDFVNPEEYVAMQVASNNWDHTEVHGYSYGADVAGINHKLKSGVSMICCIAPDPDVIDQMKYMYAAVPILVWIDTTLQVANNRLYASGDEKRIERIGHSLQSEAKAAEVKQLASVMFRPVDDLRVDEASFVRVIKEIMRTGVDPVATLQIVG